MTPASTAIDPFAHLHNEQYLARYESPLIGEESLVILGDRKRQSLNGDWFFTLDMHDEGLRQQWYKDEPLSPEQWEKPRDYNANQGRTLSVPSSWSMQEPSWLFFEGGAWYTRDIQHEVNPQLPQTILRIGAANYQTRIFINGKFVGTHKGASTPFCVDISHFLKAGTNRLQIQVDNRRSLQRVPMRHFDWFNHGGIYRDIELIHLPAHYLKHAVVHWKPINGTGHLHVDMTLNEPIDGKAMVLIDDLQLQIEVTIRNGVGRAMVPASPQLWSPEQPHLYDVKFQFGGEVIREKIGFRHIQVLGTQVLLNGKPLRLKGICVHEDDLYLGKVSTPEDVKQRFRDAQEMGCNFLRLSHYPHHEHVAQIADEVGILLWAEIPVYWAIDFESAITLNDAKNQLCELIKRDQNRASIIFWGVGNENHDTDARLAFMQELATTAKQLDPSRLVSAACLINREQFRIEDRLTDSLDVIGVNEYFGWYEPGFEGLERLLKNSNPDKPVLISETGADAMAGHHGAKTELFTEECQAEILKTQVEMSFAASYVCGIAPWLLYDFRSERRQTVFNQGFNRKGVIAEDKKTRKLGFYALAKSYQSS
jgi:beta-glucuronidase